MKPNSHERPIFLGIRTGKQDGGTAPSPISEPQPLGSWTPALPSRCLSIPDPRPLSRSTPRLCEPRPHAVSSKPASRLATKRQPEISPRHAKNSVTVFTRLLRLGYRTEEDDGGISVPTVSPLYETRRTGCFNALCIYFVCFFCYGIAHASGRARGIAEKRIRGAEPTRKLLRVATHRQIPVAMCATALLDAPSQQSSCNFNED